MIEEFTTGDHFVTSTGVATWNEFPAKRLWRVDANGEPVEVTKENTMSDPEPTDEELLAGIIRNIDDWQSITSPELLAKYLNTAGVTPPSVKGN